MAFQFAEGLGRLFYVVDPKATTFLRVEDVPDYVAQASPFFLGFIFIEFVAAQFSEEHRAVRLNDAFGSMAAGMVQQLLNKFLLKSIEMVAYAYVWNNFCFIQLDPFSIWTWLLTFLAVDISYYFFHRSAHEFNLFWAAHVVHHSSEDYNQTTALRQSFLQTWTSWMFYLPFATFIPPPMFAAHRHLNTLFQFWIHTELVGKLGPLEYIINTPSHHRVHHGRNRYCIDKNYAGTLIIWDRMFGTFEEERDDERVVFGITHPINTFNPFTIQLHHLRHVINTFIATPGVVNKFKVLFYGPGWAPGKPRLGLIEDIPDAHYPHPYYDPKIPTELNVYLLVHFAAIALFYLTVMPLLLHIDQVLATIMCSFLIFSFTCLGALFDRKSYGYHLELARMFIFIFYLFLYYPIGLPAPLSIALPVNLTVGVFCLISAGWLVWRHQSGKFFGSIESTTTTPKSEKKKSD